MMAEELRLLVVSLFRQETNEEGGVRDATQRTGDCCETSQGDTGTDNYQGY